MYRFAYLAKNLSFSRILLPIVFIIFVTTIFLSLSYTPVYGDDFVATSASECDVDHNFETSDVGASLCKHAISTTGFPSITDKLDDPLPEGRFTSLGQIISSLSPFLLTLGGMVAFLFLIMGGFRYMTAQGDPKAIASARGTLTSAIVGLALLASIFVILLLVEFIFKINVIGSIASPAYAQIDIGKQFLFGGKGVSEVFPDLGTFLGGVVNIAIGLAGVVFFTMLVWGGIRYTSAQGDEKAISDARGTLTNAVIGLLIVIASFAIIKLISIATGATISIF